jgi:hypothetical protein
VPKCCCFGNNRLGRNHKITKKWQKNKVFLSSRAVKIYNGKTGQSLLNFILDYVLANPSILLIYTW